MARINTEQAFKDEVLQSSTPVLVHFWAPWCGLCRMIDPILERARAEFGDNFKLVGVNADENLKLASSYRITNLPTVLLFQEGKLEVEISEFFSTFVIQNLLHIHEVYRHNLGTLHYSNLLARSITVLFAFQQLIFIEKDIMQIFVHCFYIPTLDDCLSLASQVTGPELSYVTVAAEYFIVEMLRFLSIIGIHEYTKEIIHFLISNLSSKASTPNKGPLLFSLSSICEVYSEISLNLDYKDRDMLIDLSCQIINEAQEKLAELMNRYFDSIPEDKGLEVVYLIDCYQRALNLSSKILQKSYLYLTECVVFY